MTKIVRLTARLERFSAMGVASAFQPSPHRDGELDQRDLARDSGPDCRAAWPNDS